MKLGWRLMPLDYGVFEMKKKVKPKKIKPICLCCRSFGLGGFTSPNAEWPEYLACPTCGWQLFGEKECKKYLLKQVPK